jgi:hypothetical protein
MDIIYILDIAQRDIIINNIQDLIKSKKQLLKKIHHDIKTNKYDNVYLNEIVANYNEYFDNDALQKTKQYNALLVLSDYITQFSLDPSTTADMKNQNKYDQQMVLAEIKKYKK